MAFDGDMHSSGAALSQSAEFALERLDLGEDLFGDPQQALPRRRQLERFRAPHEKFDAGLILQPLDLMAQCGLGDMQHIRRAGDAARLMDGPDRSQVPQLDMHYISAPHNKP